MGIIVQPNQNRSDLQKNIANELRESSQKTSKTEGSPDLVEGSEYTKDYTKPGKFSWFWFVLVALAFVAILVILFI